MAKTKVASAGRTPKSNVEIIRDNAIKIHARHRELIEEIERLIQEFREQELSREALDWPAALERLSRRIKRVGARSPLGPKDPGPKQGPSKDTGKPHKIPHPASSTAKRRKNKAPTKHRPSKKHRTK